MDAHIVSLTDHLIEKYGFDLLNEESKAYPIRVDFVKHVALQLETVGLRKIKPPKLGEILGELKIGDVMASEEQLFLNVHFSGDCTDLLRSIVASCLAHVITDRLRYSEEQEFPPFRRKRDMFAA